MILRLQYSFGWTALLLLTAAVGLGCTPPTPTPLTTSAEITASATPGPTLAGDEGIVIRTRDGEEIEIGNDVTEPIKIGDEIRAEQGGRGTLSFPTRLTVEVFEGTTLELIDVDEGSNRPYFVSFNHQFGSSLMQLHPNRSGSIRVNTTFAEITAHDLGTDFLVCHSPEPALTCVVVRQGEVSVKAKDQAGTALTVHASEAINIPKGEAAQSPVCINADELEGWLDEKESIRTGDAEFLGDLVANWPMTPSCDSQVVEATSTPAITDTPFDPEAAPTVDPSDMVRIEAGLYLVGRVEADDFHVATREVDVAEFWIDRHEVTNAQYQAFLDENNWPPPVGWTGAAFSPGEEQHPVKGVTWHDSLAFCEWSNKRLPTEAEWEIAARGPDSLLYPWGNELSADGIAGTLPRSDTYSVGSIPLNQSDFGVFDMAGNVWEWVGESYDPIVPGDHKLLRGGRHGLLRDMAYRQTAAPSDESFVKSAGFRCAADVLG